MYHLRRWNQPTSYTHNPSHVTTATSSSSITTVNMMNQPQQQQRSSSSSSSSSQIPMQLEIAMKQMKPTYENYDDYTRDNMHHHSISNRSTDDEITMEDCRRRHNHNQKSNSTLLPVLPRINESTIQQCYYSITSLFRNHKKVVLQDGLTKCRLARDEPPPRPVASSSSLLLSDDTTWRLPPPLEEFDDIDTTRTGNNSKYEVQIHRQLVNEFDRSTVSDQTNNTKKQTTSVYRIDTSIVQEHELLLPSKTKPKKSSSVVEDDHNEDDQITALETPSPVHTDDETDDDDTVPRNFHEKEEPKHLKFFRRGKLV